jgi:hypothetical protein
MDLAVKVPGIVVLTLALLASAAPLGPPWSGAQQGASRRAPALPPTQGEIPEGFAHRRESAHFVFVWRPADTTPEDIEVAVVRAEHLWARVARVLGPERVAPQKLLVMFEGDWRPIPRGPTEPPRYPHVDAWGRIHLFRFPAWLLGGDYLGRLGKQLVRAVRMPWRWQRRQPPGPAFEFVEEGFAEWLATHVEPHSLAFPYYGFPLPVVAGQWLLNQEAPPLRTLLEHHDRLNRLCRPQASSLRGSFFQYLHATFGQEALLQLAYSDDELTTALFPQVFGREFDALAQDWRAQTLTTFAATAQGAQLARDYRATTPVHRMYICQAGQDY